MSERPARTVMAGHESLPALFGEHRYVQHCWSRCDHDTWNVIALEA